LPEGGTRSGLPPTQDPDLEKTSLSHLKSSILQSQVMLHRLYQKELYYVLYIQLGTPTQGRKREATDLGHGGSVLNLSCPPLSCLESLPGSEVHGPVEFYGLWFQIF
jgi:hypothetical protein